MSPPQPTTDLAYPAVLRAAFKNVGEPEAVFRPMSSWMAVTLALEIIVCVLAGVIVLAARGGDTGSVSWFLSCLILLAFGVIVLRWLWWKWWQVLLVCPGGLIRPGSNVFVTLCWTEISQIVECGPGQSISHPRGDLLLRIEPNSGNPWLISSGHVAFAKPCIALLRQKAELHGIPWTSESAAQDD